MEIIPYESKMASELALSYNNLVNDLPHCYPICAEDFESATSIQSHSRLSQESILVARESSSIAGFIHFGVQNPRKKNEEPKGIIRFFWYEKKHRMAGQALLEVAENCFRECNLKQIRAFHQNYRYPFYHLDHVYLSDRLGHIHGLMGINGYKREDGEVYLDWPNYDPVAPISVDLPFSIDLEWEQEKDKRPGISLHAYHEGKDIGSCVCISAGEFTNNEAAQDWLFTVWIRVIPKFQGRSLGKHLLQRALQEAYGVGYRHAVISTNIHNYRALLFYSNFGYHVVDWTYGLHRKLK